ncbi:MAG TPA: endonuclease Q family protein [Bacilli bacterium]
MKTFFADLHIHIGRAGNGQVVKISGSKDLTFFNIAHEASERKGIGMVGIIDCHSPSVQADIIHYLETGEMRELPGGGIRYKDTTVLLGSEIEVHDPGMGAAHLLVFMPDLATMRQFTQWMAKSMKNVELSSQRIYVTARELQRETIERGGIMIPAHIFTPHKGVLGSSTDKMSNMLDVDKLAAVELGLSADTEMAGLFTELEPLSFVSDSDAHSLGKIAREYNKLLLAEPSFAELKKALLRQDGRKVAANYGLNPRLGKYHRTFCKNCNAILGAASAAADRCPDCGSTNIVRGVWDRIISIADRKTPHMPAYRPPYFYQVPLEFIPGLGKKLMNKLLDRFGTEMNILHRVDVTEIADIVGNEIAGMIEKARNGTLELATGGGGTYGKVIS